MTLHPIHLHVHDTVEEMGSAAGDRAAQLIREALAAKGSARVMLAAAPSQAATLRTLAAAEDLDFSAVTFFHMDDYIGLPLDAPQGFGNWLETNFLSLLPTRPTFHRIPVDQAPAAAAEGYAATMGDAPFDVLLCGLGVNAHLAFNDPPANFTDPQATRVITLDQVSRRQQTDEGHFPTVDDVPEQAVTVTIPRLLDSAHVVCSVPGPEKRDAVTRTLALEPTPDVPGTALKTHPDVHLYVDADAAPREGGGHE